MLASRWEEVNMRERVKQFAIAVLLTGTDAALFDRYFGAVWPIRSADPRLCGAFLLLLVLWAASAAVMWIHVYYDLRQTLRERCVALSLEAARRHGELRRDGDV